MYSGECQNIVQRQISFAFVFLLLTAGYSPINSSTPSQPSLNTSELPSLDRRVDRTNHSPQVKLDVVNIVPLGDSITQAEKGYNSYRRSLNKKLLAAGYQVNFVGSMNQTKDCTDFPSQDFDFDHEGHWGWRIDEVIEGRQAQCSGEGKIADWLNNYTPDLALIHLGTNDVFRGDSVSSSSAELKQIVEILRQKNPNIAIFIAQLIPTDDKQVNKAIIDLNQQITTLVAEINQTNSPVILVDQYSGFNPRHDTYDGVHPNLQGEEKIAQKWFEAIDTYLKSVQKNYSSAQ